MSVPHLLQALVRRRFVNITFLPLTPEEKNPCDSHPLCWGAQFVDAVKDEETKRERTPPSKNTAPTDSLNLDRLQQLDGATTTPIQASTV